MAEASDGREAVAETKRLRPDIAVLDIRMPKLDGLTAASLLLGTLGAGTKVLLLTTYNDDEYVYRAVTS